MSAPQSLPHVAISAAFPTIARSQSTRIWWTPPTGIGLTPADVDELLAITDDTACLVTAYRAILRREADPAGMEVHAAALAAGATRLERIIGLANSSEGRAQPGASDTLAALRATQVATFLARMGSEVGRDHLLATRELEDLWVALWIDAARQMVPIVLRTPRAITNFRRTIHDEGNPRAAFVAAWRTAAADLPLIQRLVERLRIRVTWRRSWVLVEHRFNALVATCAALVDLVNGRDPVSDA